MLILIFDRLQTKAIRGSSTLRDRADLIVENGVVTKNKHGPIAISININDATAINTLIDSAERSDCEREE